MSYFLHVLTPKGLRFLIDNHRDDQPMMHAVKKEIEHRKLENQPVKPVRHRETDGYEKDE